jgi:hypothetical protein
MKKEEELGTRKERRNPGSWEPMKLTPVGNLDVIQGVAGSQAETGAPPMLMVGS